MAGMNHLPPAQHLPASKAELLRSESSSSWHNSPHHENCAAPEQMVNSVPQVLDLPAVAWHRPANVRFWGSSKPFVTPAVGAKRTRGRWAAWSGKGPYVKLPPCRLYTAHISGFPRARMPQEQSHYRGVASALRLPRRSESCLICRKADIAACRERIRSDVSRRESRLRLEEQPEERQQVSQVLSLVGRKSTDALPLAPLGRPGEIVFVF